MKKKNIAGMSLKGGRRDNFYFCLLEYFEDKDRWFLRSLLQVKDEECTDGDDAIRSWIDSYQLSELVVNCPLTTPPCESCTLECPGSYHCPVSSVKSVRKKIDKLLEEDAKLCSENPKRYEQDRNKDDEVDFGKDITKKQTSAHILSRAYKRRLKKGFLPYWNRIIDYWIWHHFYDQLLDLFNISFDSFGNTSMMLMSRFTYLRRHFPPRLKLYEGNIYIVLVELLRSKVILKRDVNKLSDLEEGYKARRAIVKAIGSKLNIFIYDHDQDILVENVWAFESFLLALAGHSLYQKKVRKVPSWVEKENIKFVVPAFD